MPRHQQQSQAKIVAKRSQSGPSLPVCFWLEVPVFSSHYSMLQTRTGRHDCPCFLPFFSWGLRHRKRVSLFGFLISMNG